MHDQAFRAAHGVRVLRLGNPASAVAVKAIYDCFKHVEECVQWQQRYLRA
jgi:hypothetical protein